MNKRETNTLEKYIDTYGLPHVLETLTHICFSKALAITKAQENKYDSTTIHMSNRWDKAGIACDSLAEDRAIIATTEA